MQNLVNNPYFKTNKLVENQVIKKNYTTRTIDVRSTVKDFASSNGRQVVSSTTNKSNLLQRTF